MVQAEEEERHWRKPQKTQSKLQTKEQKIRKKKKEGTRKRERKGERKEKGKPGGTRGKRRTKRQTGEPKSKENGREQREREETGGREEERKRKEERKKRGAKEEMAQGAGEIMAGEAVLVSASPAVRGVVVELERGGEAGDTLRVLAPGYRTTAGKWKPPGVWEIKAANLPKTKRHNPRALEGEEEVQQVVREGGVNTAWITGQLREQERAERAEGREGRREPRGGSGKEAAAERDEEEWIEGETGYEGDSESEEEEEQEGRPGSSKDVERRGQKGGKKRIEGRNTRAGEKKGKNLLEVSDEEGDEEEEKREERRAAKGDRKRRRRETYEGSSESEEELSTQEEESSPDYETSEEEERRRRRRKRRRGSHEGRRHGRRGRREREDEERRERGGKPRRRDRKNQEKRRKRQREEEESDSSESEGRDNKRRRRESNSVSELSSGESSGGYDFRCCFEERDTRGARQERWRLKGDRLNRRMRRKALRCIYTNYRKVEDFVKERVTEAKEEGPHRPFQMDVLWLKHTAEVIDKLLPGCKRRAWGNWNEPGVDKLVDALLELVVRISPKRAYPDCLDEKVRKWMGKKQVGAKEMFGPVPEFIKQGTFRETGIVTERREPFRRDRGWGGNGRGGLPVIHRLPFGGQQSKGRGRGGTQGGNHAAGQTAGTG